ncbi:MAG: hypothetical protein QW794_02180 [Thermosphaera sp.]
MKTRDELTFIVNCTGDKYRFISLGLRVFEGGDYLIKKEESCSLVSKLIKCFNSTFTLSGQGEDIIKMC